MIISWIIVLFSSLTAVAQLDNPILQSIDYTKKSDQFLVELKFDRPVNEKQLDIEFINSTIQLNIKDAFFPDGKSNLKVKQNEIKSLYTYQAKSNLLRTRIIYDAAIQAVDYKKNVKLEVSGQSVFVRVDHSVLSASMPLHPPIALGGRINQIDQNLNESKIESANTEEMQLNAEEILQKDLEFPTELPEKKQILDDNKSVELKADSQTKFENVKEASKLPEDQIPVLTEKVKTENKVESISMGRLGLSLIIVIVFSVALIVGTKYWTRNRLGVQPVNQMRVLTQHHLGPKKSLMIVQVAGESILIGVTDQNINLIKTLSLIDDEVPADLPNNFGQELIESDVNERVTFSNDVKSLNQKDINSNLNQKSDNQVKLTNDPLELSLNSIQSLVSNKLKEMRTL